MEDSKPRDKREIKKLSNWGVEANIEWRQELVFGKKVPWKMVYVGEYSQGRFKISIFTGCYYGQWRKGVKKISAFLLNHHSEIF